jgi:hypothetical protein
MIPAAVISIAGLPLDANGKLDRRRLPVPVTSRPGGDEILAPRNTTEEVLARIFADVLGEPTVGVDDNFFELGGHSLLATQVVARAQAEGIELVLPDLFIDQTVAALAQRFAAKAKP